MGKTYGAVQRGSKKTFTKRPKKGSVGQPYLAGPSGAAGKKRKHDGKGGQAESKKKTRNVLKTPNEPAPECRRKKKVGPQGIKENRAGDRKRGREKLKRFFGTVIPAQGKINLQGS